MSADASSQKLRPIRPVYRFGDFELRPESGELFRNGIRVRVQEQSLQVLLALLENPGIVVSREQLRERLWPTGTFVDFEHSLNAAVKRLRAALADDASDPRYIETLPRRGYRLLVDVSTESPVLPDPVVPPPAASESASKIEPRPRRKLLWIATACALLLILTSAGIVALRLHKRAHRAIAVDSPQATVPQNPEAYELYLQSLGYKVEFPVNEQAVRLLERSVALDPSSARSWYELARRYNCEFYSAARGQAFLQQAREANRRALQLAPDFLPAKVQQVSLDMESGQTFPAYDGAHALVRENPGDARTHFALANALRYGGMLKEAAKECEVALKLDPSNPAFRSCSLVYVLLGRYDRSAAYVDLDSISYYAHYRRMELAILKNENQTALEIAQSIRVEHAPYDYADARMMESVLAGKPPETVRYWSDRTEALYDRITAPEAHFVVARYHSWAGQTDAAARMLRRAILNGYCGYPAMDSDPMLANLRRLPEYQDLRRLGMQCYQNFLAHTKQAE